MTRMPGPDYTVACILVNTHTRTAAFDTFCWFRGTSVGGSFRRVKGRDHPRKMQPTGCLHDSADRLRRGGDMVG